MKDLPFYKSNLSLNGENEVFEYLKETLQPTNRSWDYFVDWEKVRQNVDDIDAELSALDELIGHTDVKNAILEMAGRTPSIKKVLPILIACRSATIKNKFKILENFDDIPFVYKHIDLSSEISPKDILEFMENTGIITLFEKGGIKSFRSFVLGVETGLDTHARKNRSGKTMESVVQKFIAPRCKKHGWNYISQAKREDIMNKYRKDISVKEGKIIDFVIKTKHALFLVETNFYSGSGSKLKATAGEYRNIHKKYGCPFIWITDGRGWLTDNSLKDAFGDLDYVLNLRMMQDGLLEAILCQKNP